MMDNAEALLKYLNAAAQNMEPYLENVRMHLENGDVEKAMEKARALAASAESFSVTCRNISVYAPAAGIPHTCARGEDPSITAAERDGVLVICMPLLRSRRNANLAKEYLQRYDEPLRRLVPRMPAGRYTLWFRHFYMDMGKWGALLDHDNVETKSITDMVTCAMGLDDQPGNISIYMTAEEGDTFRTEVWIIPEGRLSTIIRKEVEGI